MSIGRDPLFRDQYAGGGDYSDDVAAALNGSYVEEEKPLTPVLQDIAKRRQAMSDVQFGPPVKLR